MTSEKRPEGREGAAPQMPGPSAFRAEGLGKLPSGWRGCSGVSTRDLDKWLEMRPEKYWDGGHTVV